MPFKERITIEERLTVHIKDVATGEVITKEIKVPEREKSWWDRFLETIGFKAKIGTILTEGWEQIAREVGAVGSSYPISQIGARYGGTYVWKTSQNSIDVGGPGATLTIANANDLWSNAENFNLVVTRNQSGDVRYNSIPVTVNNGSGTLEWWAEVEYSFT